MKIEDGKVVIIDYTLKDTEDNVMEQSTKEEPLAYLHGSDNVIAGLEKALTGKLAGDNLTTTIKPAEGYGERDDTLLQTVERNLFEGMDVEPGMQFHAQTNHGMQVVTVVKANDEEITIDGNHPMAGQTLVFDVTIREVRDATDEEKDHGHVHGPGGHHH